MAKKAKTITFFLITFSFFGQVSLAQILNYVPSLNKFANNNT
jgi:hypothetical protein